MINLIVIVFAFFIFYRYYIVPKAEIKRYKTILQNLGYKVYEQSFSFFGMPFVDQNERGKKHYNDIEYFERAIYPSVDVSIGNVFDKIVIILINPDLIKDFSVGDISTIYPKYEKLIVGIKAVIGQGLGFSEGQQWKNKRKLLSKVFNFNLVKENIPKMKQICDKCYDVFDSNYLVGQNKFTWNIHNVSVRIFNRVMMQCFFGSSDTKQEIMGIKYEQFMIKTTGEAAELTLDPFITIFGKLAWNIGMTSNIRQIKHSIHLTRMKAQEILKKRVEEVKNAPKSQRITDMIQALVYQKIANNQEFEYSDKDLIDEFQTFSVVGTDSTTRFFTMLIYFLGKYTHIQQKVREHIDQFIKADQDIVYDNLKKLTYVDWLQFQTTRYFGPANGIFYRIATEDNKLGNLPITKGTLVSTQPKGNHFNPKYFKQPQVFRPERWESECDNLHPYAFIGFSSGPRNCIGKQLAYLSTKIALVKFIRRYKTIEVPNELTFGGNLLYEAQPFDITLTK